MYDEVNCADGTSLAAPMANVLVIYYSLMAIKQQGNYFAAFEHAVMAFVIFFLNTFFAVDQLLMGIRWTKKESRTEQNWPTHFAAMDFAMFFLLLVMDLSSVGVVSVYTLLLTDAAGWREQARRNVERAAIHPAP